MYANQIMAALEERGPDQTTRALVRNIELSHQFWLGEIFDLYDVFPEVFDLEKLLTGEFAEYLKSPYERTFFCYTYEDEKLGFTGVPGLRRALYWRELNSGNAAIILFVMTVGGKWCPAAFHYNYDRDQRKLICAPFSKNALNVAVAMEEGERHNVCAAMCAMVLLNCKNVIVSKEGEVSKKQNRGRKKKGKRPLLSYHVLKVRPHKGRGEISECTEEHVRVHLCRGHFKHYTDDAPLFGKYTGMYWWQPQVRGRDRSGIVLKDYDASGLSPDSSVE